MQAELDNEWEFIDAGFPQWKKNDPLGMELLRMQRQLDKTSLIHVEKRAWISAEIEELQEKLWEGR